jgi:hypothetical protein
VRTTWLPFTDRLPVELRAKFVQEIVNGYVNRHPADQAGVVHVGMMRIEVEAHKRLEIRSETWLNMVYKKA